MGESFSAAAGVDGALYGVRSLRPGDHGSPDCKRRDDVEGGLMIFLLRSSANTRRRPVTGTASRVYCVVD